jgi:long-chain acyl-CoA synthetase
MKKKNTPSTVPHLFSSFIHKGQQSYPLGWIQNNEIKLMSNKEYYERVRNLTLGLKQLGVKAGDKVAILSNTRKEWHLFDLAIMCLGGVVVPIYPTYEGSELEFILNQSESSFVVVENDFQKTKLQKLNLDRNNGVLLIEEAPSSETQELNTFTYLSAKSPALDLDPDEQFQELINSVSPEHTASIIYTSGTTGEPKGVVITHKAICSMLDNVYSFLKSQIQSNDRSLIFLPLSHVLGRCDSITGMKFGIQKIYAESTEQVIDHLKEAKPTILISVPRIFEKIYEVIHTRVSEAPIHQRKTFQWACSVSQKYFDKLELDRSPTTAEIFQRNIAYKLVFKKIYDEFGGAIRFFVSGGAPLSPEIIRFMRYCNLTILEGYGLTETIAPCTLNPANRQIPGTVGLPIGDVQIKFAKDGEILIKSEALFSGYYKRDDLTNECLHDGWFATGDIGFLNSAGYLQITDRKKDLIITSAGKNIAPQKLEILLQKSPYIAHFVPVGDQRKFISGLVALERSALGPLLDQLGLSRSTSLEELAENPAVVSVISEAIEQANEHLQSFEKIKKFKVLPIELLLSNNLLTPSLKVKRNVVLSRYAELVNAMYQ